MRTVRGRFAVALAAVAALSVLVTAAVAYGLVSRFAQDEALRQLRRDASVLSRQSIDEDEPVRLRMSQQLRIALQLLGAAGDRFARIGPAGRIVSDDPLARSIAEEAARRTGSAVAPAQGILQTGGRRYAFVRIPVGGRGDQGGAVLLARPAELAGDLFRPVVVRVALAGAVAVLVALLVSAWIAGRVSGRVRRLAEAAGSIAAGDLEHRVPVEGEDEIAELAGRFNAMAASLSEARRREREFLASVSHELRTPVTAIRGYAGAITDGTAATPEEREDALAVIDGEAARLERLVQDVVDLARLGSNEFRLEPGNVDLSGALDEAAAAHAAQAADAGLRLESAIERPLRTTTDAARVRQIVSNLVENAMRVTPAGGTVRIGGRIAGGFVCIDISDTGPGIAAADVPHVFERAYLWNAYKSERRVGTGLGLAIVRDLAVALGGRVDVASEPGRGTTFRLSLPIR